MYGGARVALLSLACAWPLVACHRDAHRPNVVLISIDSQRPDHLDCYGYKSATGAPTSPHLDRFAKEGVLFEHAVSTTSWTMASHLALLCGLPDLVHGGISDENGPTPARVPIAEALRRAGYSTSGFYSGPYLEARYGLDVGFDSYEDASGVELRDPGDVAEKEEAYNRACSAGRVTDRVLRFLEDRKRAPASDPFFLFVHYFDVHYDYVPPEERYAARFWKDGARPRIDGEDYFSREDVNPKMSAADLAGVISYYDGEILWVDEQLGRVFDRLQRLGLDDDTLVIIVSDHGDEFFEHGCKGHRQNLFEPTLDVVTMLRLPGRLPAGKRVASRISLVDVAPTIVDLTGSGEAADTLAVKDPALVHGMWGRSLMPMIEGRETADRETLGFLANRWQDRLHPVDSWALWTGAMKVIVSRRYDWNEQKLLRESAIEGHVFDLANDHAERRDLVREATPAVGQAIARFDEVFGPRGALFRLTSALPAGAPPRFESTAERDAERERLRQQGYPVGESAGEFPKGPKVIGTLPHESQPDGTPARLLRFPATN